MRSLLELSDEMEVVAEAPDGAEAIRTIPEVNPDVVLLDMRMPGLSGLDVLRDLSERQRPSCRRRSYSPPLMTTNWCWPGIHAGAKGYLLKDVALEELVSAIKTVAGGGSIVKPAVTERLLKGLENMQTDFSSLDRPDPLTERETEILRLMAGGYSNKEIANSLGVAEGTVKNHVSNILSKLGVRDRTRAVLKAFELGFI